MHAKGVVNCQSVVLRGSLRKIHHTMGSSDVVYLDQQIGDPHTVCWSKYFFMALKPVFRIFPTQTEKGRKVQK